MADKEVFLKEAILQDEQEFVRQKGQRPGENEALAKALDEATY